MKQTLLLISFALGLSSAAFAGACVSDTLADYETDGSCTFDGLTFSGFTYTGSGSAPITAAEISVTPVDVAGEIGLQFSDINAGPGETTNSVIQFTAAVDPTTCSTCMIDDLVLTQDGASASPGGFVNITETSPVLMNPLAVGATPTVSVLSASATFPPVDSVFVTKSIAINGGTTTGIGSQDGLVTNLFSLTTNSSTVPEPSLFILCAGVLGLVPIARRKFIA